MQRRLEDVVNVDSQQQVNVMSIEDDEFSTDDEHVSSCHVVHSSLSHLWLLMINLQLTTLILPGRETRDYFL